MGVAAFIAKRDKLFRLGCISMAKNQEQFTDKDAPLKDYYELKTDAVDRLINAKNAPVVSEKEIKQYKSGWKRTIPTWVKILFVKFWFGGAICYFFVWGLQGFFKDLLDFSVVISVGLGVCTDLMINKLLRYFEPEKGEYDKWIMVTVRKFWSIFLNIIYSGVLFFFIYQTYIVVNTWIFGSNPGEAKGIIGVEPIMFGLLFMGYDMLFIFIKNMVKKAFRDAEAKVSNQK